MLAVNLKTKVVVRVFLISVMLLSSLASSAASVQAGQELKNADTSIMQQETIGCNAGPCSATPPQSTRTPSFQSFDASGSVTGITDPTLIPNSSVYDFSADAPDSIPTSFPGGTFSGDRQVLLGAPGTRKPTACRQMERLKSSATTNCWQFAP
jgi:hypothetical protein